jgi:hypothetical protein
VASAKRGVRGGLREVVDEEESLRGLGFSSLAMATMVRAAAEGAAEWKGMMSRYEQVKSPVTTAYTGDG